MSHSMENTSCRIHTRQKRDMDDGEGSIEPYSLYDYFGMKT